MSGVHSGSADSADSAASAPAGRLAGKVAVVTGAANGIGRAAAARFAAEGANVVIADVDQVAGASAAEEISAAAGAAAGSDGGTAGRAIFHATDVGDRSSIDALIAAAVSEFGGIDVMYNNAGVAGVPRRFLKDTFADFDTVIGVSLLGAIYGCQAAARHMVEQGRGGSIINTASLAGLTPGAGVTSYRVAKAGVIHLTRCLALELAEHGIRVNAIAPANIPTAINAHFDLSATIRMTQPLPSEGSPDDVASAALFLASDDSAQTTGMVLPVDGGTSVGVPVARMAEIMAVRPADPRP